MTKAEPDISIVQLVFSFVCHELAGPVGAVNNGLELIADFGGAADTEAMDLVTDSARQSACELEFARLAFGAGGGTGKSLLASAPAICKSIFESERVAFTWSLSKDLEEPPRNVVKLMANMALVARQALKGRGALSLAAESSQNDLKLTATADGPGTRLDETLERALLGDRSAGSASPVAAQAYFTAALAAACNGEISVAAEVETRYVITATVPTSNED